MDRELRKLAEKYALVYTRYLDDLTFSSNVPIGSKKRQAIRKIISKAKFKINHKKVVRADLSKRHAVINGVCIEGSGRYFLPRFVLKELQAMLHEVLSSDNYYLSFVHEIIAGKMGLFKSMTNVGSLNATEKRVMGMYARFKIQSGKK